MTAPIELFYWPTPNGYKIAIYLEEAGVPYNVNLVNIGKGDQFKPEFLKISPNNRMPAIIDPEGPGGEPVSVFESGAILQYLGRKFKNSIPRPNANALPSRNGCSGRLAGLAPWPGRHIISAIMRPKRLPMALTATPMRSTGFTA
nr:glutathione S-transferase N-terminal domain-containing protein [Marinicella sp. W31]MDC2876600.1 glutathione S-transferase N-terminal domain-containing protein [Marinicella sp. W31]